MSRAMSRVSRHAIPPSTYLEAVCKSLDTSSSSTHDDVLSSSSSEEQEQPQRRPRYGKPKHRPGTETTRLVGRPKVRLPCSQLLLGRTSPPWNARSWRILDRVSVVDDELRVAGACDFKACPPCLPAADVTLRYRVRFSDMTAVGMGLSGVLPGLLVGGRGGGEAAWCKLIHRRRHDGHHITARVWGTCKDHFELQADDLRADVRPDMHGAWTEIVVHVKLNTFDEDLRPVPNGRLTVCVDGKASSPSRGMIWRTKPSTLVSAIIVSARGGLMALTGFFVT